MLYLYTRYLVGTLFGFCIGYISINTQIVWLTVSAIAVILTAELVGWLGFDKHWEAYRQTIHTTHTGPLLCICFGTIFGNGTVGHFLIKIGRMIS